MVFVKVILPFVESSSFYVGLQSFVLNDELHPLEKRGRGGWRLFPQQNVNGVGDRVTQLAFPTDGIFTALWILAVRQAVLVVISAIRAILLQRDIATGPKPARIAPAFPFQDMIGFALSMTIAPLWTSFQSAMLSIPAIST